MESTFLRIIEHEAHIKTEDAEVYKGKITKDAIDKKSIKIRCGRIPTS